MNTATLSDKFPALTPEAPEPPRRMTGLAIVIAVHLLIGYALASGLANKAIEVIKKPLQATLVQEIKPEPPPPPPPPPKQVVKAPTPPKAPPPPFVPPPDAAAPPVQTPPPISAVTHTPPTEPTVIAPPAPPAPPAPSPVAKADIGLVCPSQVAPEMPAKALREGVVGLVRAEAHVIGGKVSEVKILSGPRVFYEAVRSAMLQYRCSSGSGEVIAVQEFKFELQ
jgi:protein TonB